MDARLMTQSRSYVTLSSEMKGPKLQLQSQGAFMCFCTSTQSQKLMNYRLMLRVRD